MRWVHKIFMWWVFIKILCGGFHKNFMRWFHKNFMSGDFIKILCWGFIKFLCRGIIDFYEKYGFVIFDKVYGVYCRNNFELSELFTSPCRNNFELSELFRSLVEIILSEVYQFSLQKSEFNSQKHIAHCGLIRDHIVVFFLNYSVIFYKGNRMMLLVGVFMKNAVQKFF